MVGRAVFKSRKIVLACLVVLLIITSVSVAADLGKLAPEFTLKNLKGRSESLSNYRRKGVLINFWATWCVPCLTEIPDLVRLQRSVANPFTVIGIAVASGDPKDITKFVKDHRMIYPILLDPDQKVYQNYRVIGLPTSFLLDPTGQIAKVYNGPQTYDRFLNDVRALLRR